MRDIYSTAIEIFNLFPEEIEVSIIDTIERIVKVLTEYKNEQGGDFMCISCGNDNCEKSGGLCSGEAIIRQDAFPAGDKRNLRIGKITFESNKGWICPKCNRVLAPSCMECNHCNENKKESKENVRDIQE